MKNSGEDLVRCEEVTRFVHVAKQFCELVEGLDSQPKVLFLQRIDELLPLLYHSACGLPDYPWDDRYDESDEGWRLYDEREKHVEELRISLAKSRSPGMPIDQRVQDKLNPHGRYAFVFDPVDPNNAEAIDGSIAHDIESVYSDVGEALELYQQVMS